MSPAQCSLLAPQWRYSVRLAPSLALAPAAWKVPARESSGRGLSCKPDALAWEALFVVFRELPTLAMNCRPGGRERPGS